MEMVRTSHLFRPLLAQLLALLRPLAPEQWSIPTGAGAWEVRDVVAHLVDGDLRRLSAERDGHSPPAPPERLNSYTELVGYLNRLNAQWVAAARRLSPAVLMDLLSLGGDQVADLMERADPLGAALYPVSWAGETQSRAWLDHGREYTERWHHQDQVRAAVGAAPLRQPAWLRPVIEISLLALPHAYRRTEAPDGTAIALEVSGPSGGTWTLERRAASWRLAAGPVVRADCHVRTDDYALARLLLHELDPRAAQEAVEITGASELAQPFLRARAVMV